MNQITGNAANVKVVEQQCHMEPTGDSKVQEEVNNSLSLVVSDKSLLLIIWFRKGFICRYETFRSLLLGFFVFMAKPHSKSLKIIIL